MEVGLEEPGERAVEGERLARLHVAWLWLLAERDEHPASAQLLEGDSREGQVLAQAGQTAELPEYRLPEEVQQAFTGQGALP